MNFEQSADIEANTPITVMAGQCLKWQRERIAALEAENESLRELARAVMCNDYSGIWCQDVRVDDSTINWFDRRDQLLTPEGGGK